MRVPDIFECSFDLVYLSTILTMGFRMWSIRGNNKEFTYFSLMSILLGLGDCFHLFPRIYSKTFGSSDLVVAATGLGNLITGISMTVYYVLFLELIRIRYKRSLKCVSFVVYLLFVCRLVCMLLPQNDWIHNHRNLTMSIIRNVPFTIIGIMIVYLLFNSVKGKPNDAFKFMWLYVLISFGCYAPVVFCELSGMISAMLMIMKTMAYVKMACVGYLYLTPDTPKGE